MFERYLNNIWRAITYLIAAAFGALLVSLCFLDRLETDGSKQGKLYQLLSIIDQKFVEDVDRTALEDAAAEAMLKATGDRWSYYIPASEYQAHIERRDNVYVGVGITLEQREDETGLEIVELAEGGGAEKAGLQVHDVLVGVDGQSCAELGVSEVTPWIQGEAGSNVVLTVDRNGQELDFTVTRGQIELPVATYEMLPSGSGLITIENFEARAAEETLAAVCPGGSRGRAASFLMSATIPAALPPSWWRFWMRFCLRGRCFAQRAPMARRRCRTPTPAAWSCRWRFWSTNTLTQPQNFSPLPCRSMTLR